MIAWLDVETTGLDPELDALLEVGIIITTDQLEEVANRSVVLPVDVSSPRLQRRLHVDNDGIVGKMHTANGLLKEVAYAVGTVWAAERQMIDLMLPVSTIEKPIMGGSSITLDRSFLAIWMPELLEQFHYRSLDVSSLREAARRWLPELTEYEPVVSKDANHRVLDDLRASIELARFYKNHLSTTLEVSR